MDAGAIGSSLKVRLMFKWRNRLWKTSFDVDVIWSVWRSFHAHISRTFKDFQTRQHQANFNDNPITPTSSGLLKNPTHAHFKRSFKDDTVTPTTSVLSKTVQLCPHETVSKTIQSRKHQAYFQRWSNPAHSKRTFKDDPNTHTSSSRLSNAITSSPHQADFQRRSNYAHIKRTF